MSNDRGRLFGGVKGFASSSQLGGNAQSSRGAAQDVRQSPIPPPQQGYRDEKNHDPNEPGHRYRDHNLPTYQSDYGGAQSSPLSRGSLPSRQDAEAAYSNRTGVDTMRSHPPPQANRPPPAGTFVVSAIDWKLDTGGQLGKREISQSNCCGVNPSDFPTIEYNTAMPLLIQFQNREARFVLMARPLDVCPRGHLYLPPIMMEWTGTQNGDYVMTRDYNPYTEAGPQWQIDSIETEVSFIQRGNTELKLEEPILEDYVVSKLNGHVLAPGQKFILKDPVPDALLCFTVKKITVKSLTTKGDVPRESRNAEVRGVFAEDKSAVDLKAIKPLSFKEDNNRLLKSNFNFSDMGIGGLDKEFAIIFRRAFLSRMVPPSLAKKLEIKHCKGILLFGPPGTGKTLIARKLGEILGSEHPPRIINGPEILNKYVGQSEENLRGEFKDAELEHKKNPESSGLHVIIFDELDAVCKQRGGSATGGGVSDSIVNTLLTKLDGVEELPNILLIGMTNRKDLIDEALLRPGRLEIHLEIGLPDKKGREDIFKIHTKPYRDLNHLHPDVDLNELASRSKNFSGAEISGLVRAAASYAIEREVKKKQAELEASGSKKKLNLADIEKTLIVTRDDMLKAFDDIKPAFGTSDEELDDNMPCGIIHFSPNIKLMINEALGYVDALNNIGSPSVCAVLFHGPKGSGKTALVSHVAKGSGIPFVKTISPRNLLNLSNELEKKDYINRVFRDAWRSTLSLVIVDNIEDIIEWNQLGASYKATALQTILTWCRLRPPKGHRILILVTTSNRWALEQLGAARQFNFEIEVPPVANTKELAIVLKELEIFESDAGIHETIGHLDLQQDEVNVGIQIVADAALMTAKSRGADHSLMLAEKLHAQINRNKY